MTNDERDRMLLDMHTKIGVMHEVVSDIKHDMYGNGKPGLKMDVAMLKKQAEESSSNKKDRRALFFSVAALCTAVASVAIGVWKLIF
jgi:hypothetical protein